MKKILLSITALALTSSTAFAATNYSPSGTKNLTLTAPLPPHQLMRYKGSVTIDLLAQANTKTQATTQNTFNVGSLTVEPGSIVKKSLINTNSVTLQGFKLKTTKTAENIGNSISQSTINTKGGGFTAIFSDLLFNTINMNQGDFSITDSKLHYSMINGANRVIIKDCQVNNNILLANTFCYDGKSSLKNTIILAKNSNVSEKELRNAGAIPNIKKFSDHHSGCPSSN